MATASTSPNNPMRHIWRLKDVLSWKVVLRRQTKLWRKHFNDGVYGGKRAALAAAKAWRNELLQQVSSADYVLLRRKRVLSTNTSGLVGVHRLAPKEKDGNLVQGACWQASWTDPDGRRRTRSFSIKKHGEKQAKKLAQQARREAMREVVQQVKAHFKV